MKTRVLLLAAPWFFGAALGASAAPPKAKLAQPGSRHSSTLAPQGTGSPFADVPPNHWAAQSVETLRQAGIVRGYPTQTKKRAR